MLTVTQFKVLMILLDDKGHAGWELAETLSMEESNLNPLLKKLENKDFIFQGAPRKSNRPKKITKNKNAENEKNVELQKRKGNYKEFPYFLNKDIKILGPLIKEMVITNRVSDIGFPFWVIRASKYMKSMQEEFKEDFYKCINKELQIYSMRYLKAPTFLLEFFELARQFQGAECQEIDNSSPKPPLEPVEQILLTFQEETPIINERRFSKKLLRELEAWYLKYELRRCLSQDPINIDEVSEILALIYQEYNIGKDIWEAIREAVNPLPEDQRSKLPYSEILS